MYTPDLRTLQGVVAGKGGRVYGYYALGDEPLFVEIGGMSETYPFPVRPLEIYSGGERDREQHVEL